MDRQAMLCTSLTRWSTEMPFGSVRHRVAFPVSILESCRHPSTSMVGFLKA